MTNTVVRYTRFEALRTIRNRQSFGFSLVFPAIMYLLLAAPNRNEHNFAGVRGLFAPQYYMISILAFGAMVAVLSGGARIAAERTIGWNRQLQLTPLQTSTYLATKVIVGYLMAIIAMAVLYIAGIAVGVRMPAATWVVTTLLVLLALIPFAGLGIAGGHLLNADAAGPALGGLVSLLAFLGGSWFPIGGGWFGALCKLLPSYWLVQAGRIGLGNGSLNPWGLEGWLVVAFWSVAMAVFAAWAYRRDTRRV